MIIFASEHVEALHNILMIELFQNSNLIFQQLHGDSGSEGTIFYYFYGHWLMGNFINALKYLAKIALAHQVTHLVVVVLDFLTLSDLLIARSDFWYVEHFNFNRKCSYLYKKYKKSIIIPRR